MSTTVETKKFDRDGRPFKKKVRKRYHSDEDEDDEENEDEEP